MDIFKKEGVVNGPYCIAPWVSVHVSSNGFRSVCCVARQSRPVKYLKDWWNGEDMRELRLAMLRHEPPEDICTTCVRGTRATSLAANMAQRNPEVPQIAATHTDASGATNLRPTEFHVKHIACNLQCRHCNSGSSSAIRTSEAKIDVKRIAPLGPAYDSEMQMDMDVNDLSWASSGTRHVTWAGGEPFMNPLMPVALADLHARGVTQAFHSVLTNAHFPWTNTARRILQQLKQVRRLSIVVSIDGMGEHGAFWRAGWNEDEFRKNVRTLKQELPHAKFSANFVLGSVSVLSLPAVVQFCAEENLIFKGQLISRPKDHYLSYNLLRREVLEQCFAEARVRYAKGPENYLAALEAALWRNYVPEHLNRNASEKLAFDCSIRGQEMQFGLLTKGKLNAEPDSEP